MNLNLTKRILSLVLSLVLLLGNFSAVVFAAEEEIPVPTEVVAEETVAPTEVPAVAETVAPTEVATEPVEETVVPTQPAVPEETVAPTEAPTEPAAETVPAEDVAVDALDGVLASGTCGIGVYWSYDRGILTISGSGAMNNYSKTSIPWYGYKDSIIHVEIEPGVTSIGISAFEELGILETVTIPDTVTSIGDNAFCWAESLTAVDIPGSVRTIGENAFWCCLDLTEVTFHEGLQVIEREAFTYDRLITELKLPNSLRSIGYWAFGDCTNLTKVNIPARIYALEDSVFSGCTALKTVTLKEGLTAIGNSTFAYCFALENVTIPGSVQTIGDTAFYLCEVLGTVTFTGNPPVISDTAFAGAAATVRYPECNTDWAYEIGGYSGTLFWESYSVEGHAYADAVVPATCLTWGYTSHVCTDSGCGMYYMDNYISALGHSWDGGSTSGSKTTYTCTRCGEKRYEYSASGSCGNAARWTLDTEEGILRITGTGTIKRSWNSYKDSIRHVIIEKGITAIGAECFFEYGAIESIEIPDTVQSIGMQAFVWCSSLKSVTVPEGVTSIGESTFWGCESMEELNLPSTLRSIGPENFYRCDSLKTLVIPEGVTSIGELAFWDCGGLEEITIPSTLTQLSQDMFNGCRNLHTVHLPDTLTTIGADVFSYCSALKNITIPDSVSSIGDYAFYGCKKLNNVVIPGGVSNFGKGVFSGCSSLYNLRFAGEPPTFAEGAFLGCSATVKYPYVLRTAWSAHTGNKYGGSIYWSSYSVTGHNYINTVKPADCENRGYTRHTCADSGCTMYYMDSYTPALGHTWDDGYGSETYWTYTCTRCGKTRTVYTVGGSCGSNVKWRLNTEEGLLTIYGTGNMSNYSRTPPWASYKDSITQVEVQPGVTSIGNYAFYEHSALLSVELPDTIRSLGLGSFAWAESLTSIHIPEGVTSIPEDCFWACLSMTEISLPSTVRTIGQGAFYSTDITGINLPAGLTDIGEDAFWQCYELKTVTIPEGVTVLRETVFASCTSLHTVNLHDGITEIQRSAFSGCKALKNMTLPANLRTVGVNALSRIAVPTLTFPETLTFLDIGFLYGASVKELHFLGDPPKFDAEAFYGYSGTAYYPKYNPNWTASVRQNYAGTITWIGEGTCSHDYLAEVIPPTCQWGGYTIYTCAICGDSYVDDYTDPIDHTPGEPVRENEQPNGSHDVVVYCSFCGQELSRESILLHTPGDISGDGEVDNKDLTRLFRYLSGYDVEVVEAALDVNGDGAVNNKDLTRLFQYLSGWDVTIN